MPGGVLAETLEAVATERGGQFDRSFRLVDRLLRDYGEHDLAERLYAEIPLNYAWEVVADLLGILSWTTSDNGSAITRTAERWLIAAEDLRKVRIALHLDVYPFLDREQMERVLEQVAAIHPDVSERCADLIASRRQVPE